MKKVFIDGSAGTTGLRIVERLESRNDITLVTLPEELRKDTDARKQAILDSDIVFLCLPDAAAIQAVELAGNSEVKIIDTSTAHRVNPEWIYGFPELKGMRERIAAGNRIANPGCHASGFIALVAPLRQLGVIEKDANLVCFSLTGYSGGGKKMIAEYEDASPSPLLKAPRQYGLTQQHKHLKEMTAVCDLASHPVFCPIVGDFYSGMEVTVPLFKKDCKANVSELRELYRNYYNTGLVFCDDSEDENGMISANKLSGRDDMCISVHGNDERILLTARFDNLGKGASGTAIQNMNILLGVDEKTGLCF